MKAHFNKFKVAGISSVIPKNPLDLTSLIPIYGEREVKRIIASTGIRYIRQAPEGMMSSDLALISANELFSQLNILPESIDAVVFISQTPDFIAPATSAVLQYRLNLRKNIVAFDINYGCSGYLYGLYQAGLLLSSGGCHRVLLFAGDIITPLLRKEDRHVRMVLSDAMTATLLESGDNFLSITIKTDGSGYRYLYADKLTKGDGYFHMDGTKVMEFALREVPTILDEILKFTHWSKEEVGTYILHQANQFMLEYIRKKANLAKECLPIAVETVGNTGPASIPLTLSIKSESLKEEKRLNKVVMCGFGIGLSWGACTLTLDNTLITKPIEI